MDSYNKRCGFCRYCGYQWLARVSNPKSCPRCKRRFDYKEARLVLRKLGQEHGLDLRGGA